MNEHTNTLTISSVKRVHGRASLILSSGETLPMPRAMLKERPYRGGMPFDRAQFHAFLLERSYPFALDKAVSLLASRARTEKEIVSALRQNAYPEQTIARVMARLHDEGYINDAAFAGQWVSARTAKGMGAPFARSCASRASARAILMKLSIPSTRKKPWTRLYRRLKRRPAAETLLIRPIARRSLLRLYVAAMIFPRQKRPYRDL